MISDLLKHDTYQYLLKRQYEQNHLNKCIDTHIFSFSIFFTLTSGHQSLILIVKDPDALTRVLIKRTPLVSYSSTKKKHSDSSQKFS